jgi:hypothetical protein
MTFSRQINGLFKFFLITILSVYFISTQLFAQRAMYHAGNRNIITSENSSIVSNALDFDGVNDRVISTNDDKFKLSVGTIEGWIKTSNGGSGYCGVFGKTFAYFLYLYNNTLIVYDWGGGGNRSTGITLNDNSWHHIAMSFNSGVNNGTLIYIDGVLKLTTTMTISSQEHPFTIGSVVDPYGQFYTGSIDDVRVWNVARSQTEIQNNMNSELSGTETGLVAYYPFNQGVAAGDNTSITTVTDKTANALNGNLNNLAKTGATSNFVTGKVSSPIITKSTNLGNALDFDGVNDFVNCGTNSILNLKSSMTIELWIKPAQNMGVNKWDRLIHKDWPTGYFFGGKGGSTNALAVVLSGDLNAAVTPDNTVVVGVWQHISFVFDDPANTIKIYKDGVLISTSTWTGTITGNPNSTLTLSQSGETFNGAMDEVRIWNVARTQTEIQTNMNKELVGTETGLVAYYNFNQGIAAGDNTAISTVIEKTPNAINGTLSNFNKTGTFSNFIHGRGEIPIELLIVAGGGGGGGDAAGGGGGGGVIYKTDYAINAPSSTTVTVGAGGLAGVGTNSILATNGNDSYFGILRAIGGGAGGRYNNNPGSLGGSGGGGAYTGALGGAATVNQGFSGGIAGSSGGGGGGGAGGAGISGQSGGIGGIGALYSISGSPTYYAGGGGGGRFAVGAEGLNNGGLGGGGRGAGSCGSNPAVSGTDFTGGGGGGAPAGCQSNGAKGGTGIVIVRYYGAPRATGGTITQLNGYTIHTFTSSGNFVLN